MRENGGAAARTMGIECRDARVDHVTDASRDALTHRVKLCILKFRLFKYHTDDGCVMATTTVTKKTKTTTTTRVRSTMMTATQRTMTFADRRSASLSDVTGSRMTDGEMKKKGVKRKDVTNVIMKCIGARVCTICTPATPEE